jgi:hypothetical protein
MQTKITDNALFQNFVSPELCRDIVTAGFTAEVIFQWKIYPSEIQLFSKSFDEDSYYSDGSALIDSFHAPIMRVPAYTIKEMETELPAYCLCKDPNGMYIIMFDDAYQLPSCSDKRLPDAFAKGLIQAMKKRIVNLHKANNENHR